MGHECHLPWSQQPAQAQSHKCSSDLLHNLNKTQVYNNKHTISKWFKHRHVCMHECTKINHTMVLWVNVVFECYMMFIWVVEGSGLVISI